VKKVERIESGVLGVVMVAEIVEKAVDDVDKAVADVDKIAADGVGQVGDDQRCEAIQQGADFDQKLESCTSRHPSQKTLLHCL